MGCEPATLRSMIDSRRWAIATGPCAHSPEPSGPRGARQPLIFSQRGNVGRPAVEPKLTRQPAHGGTFFLDWSTNCRIATDSRLRSVSQSNSWWRKVSRVSRCALSADDPGVLGAAAAGRVDDQTALRGDPGQRQVGQPGLARLECPRCTRRRGGRRGGAARSSPAKVGWEDSATTSWATQRSGWAAISARRAATCEADASGPISTPWPPCPSTGFVTSSPTRSSTVAALGGVAGPIRRHRLQQRTLLQVVRDQVRQIAVHALVVGHPVARRVGQPDLAAGPPPRTLRLRSAARPSW